MPYTKTEWKDRVVSNPLTYTVTAPIVANTPFTLVPAEGTITESGTPLTATNLNNLEKQYELAVAECLPLTGGEITGELIVGANGKLRIKSPNGTGNYQLIYTKEDQSGTSANGFGVAIGAGGTTIIGGGESAGNVLLSSLVPNGGQERMLVTSDNEVMIYTGMQNVGTDPTVGKRFVYGANGDFNFGGNNVDGNIGVLRYTTGTKSCQILHWNGTVSTDDVTLSVNKVIQTGASQGAVLWSHSGQYMTAGQTATPSVSLDNCANGWQLIWSDYDAGVGSNNFQFTSTFIHKAQLAGTTIHMLPIFSGDDTANGRFVIKELTNTRTVITGTANNDGLNDVCLRQVLSY